MTTSLRVILTYEDLGWIVCVQTAGEGVCRWVPAWGDLAAVKRSLRVAIERGEAVTA